MYTVPIQSLAQTSSKNGAGKPADESEEARQILADCRRHALVMQRLGATPVKLPGREAGLCGAALQSSGGSR